MSIVKKLVAGAAIVSSAVPAFAQESSNLEINTDTAEDAVNAVGTAVSGLISGPVLTNILVVLGSGLMIAFIFLGVRWMLRGGKTAAK